MATMRREQDCYSARSTRWVVVNTHAHRELLALENLARQKFKVYCPMLRKCVRHARRSQDVLRPLFPGYLFAEVNLDPQHWRPIRSTLGVRTLAPSGDRPGFLDESFIESLKAREIDGAIPASPYQPDQKGCVASGAFDGVLATILEMEEKDRITVLMDLLIRPVTLAKR
jgi:transcriptional antiterminator RfaH